MKRVAVCAFALVAIACNRPSVSEPETPAPPPAVEKTAESAPPAESQPTLSLPGTPHDEEYAQIKLTWKGQGGDAALSSAPGKPGGGTVKFEQGQQIGFGESVVLVTKPNEVVAKADAKLYGASKYSPEPSPDDASQDIDIAAGKTVSILKYEGEGTCVVSHDGTMYYAGCPDSETYEGDVNAKGEHEWWVQPKDSNGWLLVDERVKVDVSQNLD